MPDDDVTSAEVAAALERTSKGDAIDDATDDATESGWRGADLRSAQPLVEFELRGKTAATAAAVLHDTLEVVVALQDGTIGPRLHCRFVLPLIHFMPYSLTY
jgi:hypothetical protein